MKFATRPTTTTPEGLRSVPTMDRRSSFKLRASIPNRETKFSRELTKSDTGILACSVVPHASDWISSLPPNSRTRSHFPASPTPAFPCNSRKLCKRSSEMPRPLAHLQHNFAARSVSAIFLYYTP
jgi:hypothetical protein